jgi:hypothetical protein
VPKEAPFDVWDSEDLESEDVIDDPCVEEVSMHLDPDSEPDAPATPAWSELTDGDHVGPADEEPVRYFADEEPEHEREPADVAEEPEPDLEDLLERQHYSFRQRG